MYILYSRFVIIVALAPSAPSSSARLSFRLLLHISYIYFSHTIFITFLFAQHIKNGTYQLIGLCVFCLFRSFFEFICSFHFSEIKFNLHTTQYFGRMFMRVCVCLCAYDVVIVSLFCIDSSRHTHTLTLWKRLCDCP